MDEYNSENNLAIGFNLTQLYLIFKNRVTVNHEVTQCRNGLELRSAKKDPAIWVISSTDTMKTRVITISDSVTGKLLTTPPKLLRQFEIARAFPSEASLRRLTATTACELKLKGSLDGKFWKLNFVLPNRLEPKVIMEVKGVRCSTNG